MWIASPNMQNSPAPAFLPGPQALKKIKVRLVSLAPDTSQVFCIVGWGAWVGQGHCPGALFSEPRHWAFMHWEGTCLLHRCHREPPTSVAPSALTLCWGPVGEPTKHEAQAPKPTCFSCPLLLCPHLPMTYKSVNLPHSHPRPDTRIPAPGGPASWGQARCMSNIIFALTTLDTKWHRGDSNRPRCLHTAWIPLQEATLNLRNQYLL